jgi:hypothetical protein
VVEGKDSLVVGVDELVEVVVDSAVDEAVFVVKPVIEKKEPVGVVSTI